MANQYSKYIDNIAAAYCEYGCYLYKQENYLKSLTTARNSPLRVLALKWRWIALQPIST